MLIQEGRKWAGAPLLLGLLMAPAVFAQEHVVSSEELHQRAVAASASREASVTALKKFFSTETARAALAKGKLDREQVTQAVSLLGDDELARLADRARAAQNDFAAGALTTQQLTYIVIALGTAVFILIILAA